MRDPQGYAVITSPDGVKEYDTFSCGHCQRVKHVAPKQDAAEMGGLCKQCMTLICPACVERGICTPWEKQMAAMEARVDALRSYGECA